MTVRDEPEATERSPRNAGAADRVRVGSASSFESSVGFSRALRVGERVLVAGTAPVFRDGSCPPDAGAQAERCLEIISAALAEVGSSMSDVVRTRMFIVDPGDADEVGAVHRATFGAIRPAATMVVVAALLDPRWKVEIEAEAVLEASRAVPGGASAEGSSFRPEA